ncbi:pantetheinase-like [Asterias amurensis]|uniref:pantetheinase-like n=1 Tax=Asterias amurensis TaxID=7602 RepID=UPI003AB1A64D
MMLPLILTCLCGSLLAGGQPNEHGYVQHDETIHDTENDGSLSFTAAVYQHDTLNWLLPSISREEALRLMNINVDTYEEQIITAASKGVSMIVFPEYGITGLKMSNTTVTAFLEFVPNPYERKIIPCDSIQLKDSPILQRLSCLAKNYSMVVVANLAAKKPCKKTSQAPDCPPDGMYKFNTDVAFGADGQLVAKYNKINLYSVERTMFQPGRGVENLGVFQTEFGVFGLFTCFDMLFEQPAELLVHGMGITNMVFPTGWMNELPLLSAVEYQQAWAISFDVNLLAANIQLPLFQFTGGGLYNGAKGAVVYHYNMMEYKGVLVVGKLPIRKQRAANMNSTDMKNTLKQITKLTPKELLKVSPVVRAIFTEGSETSPFPEVREETQKVTHPSSPLQSSPSCDKPFISLMNHDPYTFTLLTEQSARTSVCSKGLCCYLNYTFNANSTHTELFALGVFNDLHINNGQYYIQTCALVKCKFQIKYSCGAETEQSKTRFESFSLRGEGFDPSTVLFPSVLTSGVQLPVIGKEWESPSPHDRVWSDSGTREPLLEASVFGRLYSKD